MPVTGKMADAGPTPRVITPHERAPKGCRRVKLRADREGPTAYVLLGAGQGTADARRLYAETFGVNADAARFSVVELPD